MKKEIQGKMYKLELLPDEAEDVCAGCAFQHDNPGCVAAGVACSDGPGDNGCIWVEDKPDDGWVKWSGGKCPVPSSTLVTIRFPDGQEYGPVAAKTVRWEHEGLHGDIAAYKVEAAQAPAPADASGSKPTNPKDAIGIRKAPLSTLPMGVVAEMGVAMLEGAAKYGRHNYRGVGVRASVYFDATMRHLIAWWEGEDVDPDSQLSHVTKALVSLAVLRDAMMQSKCEDDRPPRSAPFYPELNERSSSILDKHADKCPKHWTIKDTQ